MDWGKRESATIDCRRKYDGAMTELPGAVKCYHSMRNRRFDTHPMRFLRDPLMSSHGKLSLERRRVSIATMQHESHGPSGSPISTLGDSRLPSVAIVLVNWNSWRHTIECLDALLAQTYTNFCVFVVDNDSQDQSIERISEWCAKPTGDSGLLLPWP